MLPVCVPPGFLLSSIGGIRLICCVLCGPFQAVQTAGVQRTRAYCPVNILRT
ncbi:hypothetical protein HMPREF9303_1813 [Prevotella denticola CRIS 18C-A]|uniref:Uncharacterized protein n=1 Tax=Prevotella denticola CRIS 18C-A TaxID=944557 RepID=F0H6J5_9BACT|nr:hypothetical protein HMPREF9303_1813 [Prevotella denticola CRIS 18C-A]